MGTSRRGQKKRYATRSDFAALAGVSAPAITRAIREGRVVATPKGIDLRAGVNRLFVEAHAAGPRGAGSRRGPSVDGGRRTGSAALHAARIEADTALKIEQTLTHRQRRLERLGKLIERALVERRLALIGNEVKARLLDLPARVFPQLSALVLSGRGDEALQHLEREIGDAIERVKEKATV